MGSVAGTCLGALPLALGLGLCLWALLLAFDSGLCPSAPTLGVRLWDLSLAGRAMTCTEVRL